MITNAGLTDRLEKMTSLFPWYSGLVLKKDTADITRLPLMTSELLEKHYYNEAMHGDGLTVYRTSGTSSGRRKFIYYSKEDDLRYLQMKVKLFGDILADSGITKAASDMGTGHAAGTASEIFRQLGISSLDIAFDTPIGEHVKKLEAFQPELLYTMPSILDSILYRAKEPSALGIRKVILVGEVAPLEWQKKAASLLNIRPQDIVDTLGSIEIGTIAYFEHSIQRYVLVDGLIAEGVQPEAAGLDMEPLGGKEGILVITSLTRDYFPAIRFVTYDVVRDLCSITVGGRERQTFQAIVKRVGSEVKHGEKISIYDIEQVIYKELNEASVRVRVKENRLIVYIRSHSMDEEARLRIRQGIQKQIPEIGEMIENGILQEIKIERMEKDEPWSRGSVKSKKLYN